MRPASLEELKHDAAAFDASVQRTEEVDRFCSSSDWILAADEALTPGRDPWIFREENTWLAMMMDRRQAQPLEAAWGLSCPLVGGDPDRLGRLFAEVCKQQRDAWELILLTGIVMRSRLFQRLVLELAPRYHLGVGAITRRHVADLSGGLDGFLSRRSRNLRKALRQADRRARSAGISFECHETADLATAMVLYQRILAVEGRSWKGRERVGIDHGPMRRFYKRIVARLASRDALRVIFARCEDRDVAYVLGGVQGDMYRGLQFSFDSEFGRYSLGSLCQIEQIQRLAAQGYLSYDLGVDLDYKDRWSDRVMDTVLLVVR